VNQAPAVVVRELIIGDDYFVKHLHFTEWHDFETPESKDLEAYCAIILEAAAFVTHELKSESEPIRLLVHCRAGMGRTGTTVSLVNAILHLEMSACKKKADAPLSIAAIVAK